MPSETKVQTAFSHQNVPADKTLLPRIPDPNRIKRSNGFGHYGKSPSQK
ncbi:TPA: hypothetical protein ACE7IL_001212 [Neisseria gonorrhoeae]